MGIKGPDGGWEGAGLDMEAPKVGRGLGQLREETVKRQALTGL